MCFIPGLDPLTIGFAVFNTVASGVSSMLQVRAQNEAAVQQYQFQQQQQRLVNDSVVNQFNETISRQNVEAQRQGASAFETAQQSILENQRRQAAAQASASTAGITGTPLNMLFNDYQAAVGNIANNLSTTYQQLNENRFFNQRNALLEGQSRLNSAIPAPPYLAKFSPIPALLAGTGTLMKGAISNYNPTPKMAGTVGATPTQNRVPSYQPPIAITDNSPTSLNFNPYPTFNYQGWSFLNG